MGIPQNQRSFESCARNPVKIIVFICYILSGSTSRVQGYRFHYVLYSFEPGIPSLHCQNLLSENSFAKTSGRQCYNVKVLQRVVSLGDCPAGTAESACRPTAWSVWSGPMVNNVSGDAGDFSSFYLDNIERPNGY